MDRIGGTAEDATDRAGCTACEGQAAIEQELIRTRCIPKRDKTGITEIDGLAEAVIGARERNGVGIVGGNQRADLYIAGKGGATTVGDCDGANIGAHRPGDVDGCRGVESDVRRVASTSCAGNSCHRDRRGSSGTDGERGAVGQRGSAEADGAGGGAADGGAAGNAQGRIGVTQSDRRIARC